MFMFGGIYSGSIFVCDCFTEWEFFWMATRSCTGGSYLMGHILSTCVCHKVRKYLVLS